MERSEINTLFPVDLLNSDQLIPEITQLVQFEWAKTYGPRFTIALGPRNYFITNQPKDVEVGIISVKDQVRTSELFAVRSENPVFVFSETAIFEYSNQERG